MKTRKLSINKELEIIQQTLARFPQGASLQEVKEASGLDIETRSLQRRMDKLKEEGLISVSGNTRATLYHLSKRETAAPPVIEDDSEEIPLSPEGRQIKELVSRPVNQRTPVGYHIEFLTSYRPNIDSYLSKKDQQKLAKIGNTNNENKPAGTYAKEILQRLLIDLSWNSSRLEGNTYSLLDTQQLISQGKAADNKTTADAQMILNHKDAIEFIVQGAEEIGFNYYSITNLHALLSNNLLPDPAASGRLRTFGVGITNSVFTPLGIPQQIDEMFREMLEKAGAIDNPFEQAFFIMVQLPYLQPFDDVNKRVSRLAANIPLSKHNLAPLAFVDMPEQLYVQGLLGVYELNRIELFKDVFMWAYERSALRYAALRQSLGEPDTFKLKYREEIRNLVADIVLKALSQHEASIFIQKTAETFPESDRQRFVEVVDTELLSLHEGNFARYRIRPSEFKKWQDVWNK